MVNAPFKPVASHMSWMSSEKWHLALSDALPLLNLVNLAQFDLHHSIVSTDASLIPLPRRRRWCGPDEKTFFFRPGSSDPFFAHSHSVLVPILCFLLGSIMVSSIFRATSPPVASVRRTKTARARYCRGSGLCVLGVPFGTSHSDVTADMHGTEIQIRVHVVRFWEPELSSSSALPSEMHRSNLLLAVLLLSLGIAVCSATLLASNRGVRFGENSEVLYVLLQRLTT